MKKINLRYILLLSLLILFYGCNDESISYPKNVELTYDFQNNSQPWEGDFADYPSGEEVFYELNYEYSSLPAPLDTNKGALKQTGNNYSDDLFMFIRRKINDLKPNTKYKVLLKVEFATNAPDGLVGVGGAPGGVIILVGATTIKPKKVIRTDYYGMYRMNIWSESKGNLEHMIEIGNFANDNDIENHDYKLKTLTSKDRNITVSTNNQGELWLIIATDSGYEGLTTIYYNLIKVKLEKQ